MVANQKKYTDEFRRETAGYAISTGRPITRVCEELGLNPKTANDRVSSAGASWEASPTRGPRTAGCARPRGAYASSKWGTRSEGRRSRRFREGLGRRIDWHDNARIEKHPRRRQPGRVRTRPGRPIRFF